MQQQLQHLHLQLQWIRRGLASAALCELAKHAAFEDVVAIVNAGVIPLLVHLQGPGSTAVAKGLQHTDAPRSVD
jgi:hypothetical protein